MALYSDWKTYAAVFERRAARLPAAFREGTKNATHILVAESKELLNELVYSKPEDVGSFSYKGNAEKGFEVTTSGRRRVSSKGKKKWRRTGNLRRSEQWRVLSDTEGLVYNDAGYALPRHDLGLPAGHPEAYHGSKRKSDRQAPFRLRAIANTAQKRLAAYRDALWKVLTST